MEKEEIGNLIEVNFIRYTSWETGISFLLLKGRVEKDLFNKLIKSGFSYHTVDEQCEERFVGWCIRDNEVNRLKLKNNGIKVVAPYRNVMFSDVVIYGSEY